MNSGPSFSLNDLLQREKLTLRQEVGNVKEVFDLILPKDGDGKIVRPLIVGIDGAVTAGKSFTASCLHSYLTEWAYDCILIHGDWYMASRAERQREVARAKSASYSILEYDRMNCDFADIAKAIRKIRHFYRSGNELLKTGVSPIYSRESGKRDGSIELNIQKRSIVVVEGTGTLSKDIAPLLDLRIRIDIGGYQETIRRLCSREHEKPGATRLSKSFVEERYDLIDYRYDQYLRSRDGGYFDVLLDTTKPDSIKVYIR